MACEICCSDLNHTNRREVACGFCGRAACRTCHATYLCSSTLDPHCMHCRHAWSREFLDQSFPRRFVGETYKRHRENVLLDRERSLLPATQAAAETELRRRKLRAELQQARRDLSHAQREVQRLRILQRARSAVLEQRAPEHGALAAELRHWRLEVRSLRARRIAVYWDLVTLEAEAGEEGEAVSRRSFVRSCPAEGCRGFLSTQWRCGICATWVCPACHEVKGPARDVPHTCDPAAAATAKLLAADTRPCPTCGAPIFKVEGCDQMWCTQCQTAFSWRTGRVERGAVHNPHFFEFMRRGGMPAPRNPLDVPCGGLPAYYALVQHLYEQGAGEDVQAALTGAYRLAAHTQGDLLPRYRVDAVADNRDLRVRYLLGEIAEGKFKLLIQRREKARQRRGEVGQVLAMHVHMSAFILQRAMAATGEALAGVATELLSLREYADEALAAIARRYAAKPVVLRELLL